MPAFENGLHRAGGGGVVVAEDGVGTRVESEQAACRQIAAFVVGGMHHVGIGDRDAGGGERFLIAFPAAHARGERRSRDVGDAAAAALDQVTGGQAADGFIVGADVGGVGVGEAPVDQNVGNAARFDAFEKTERRRRLRRGEQQGHPPGGPSRRSTSLDSTSPSSSELQITTS